MNLRNEELYSRNLRRILVFFFQWLLQPLQGPGLFFSSVTIFFTQTVGLLGRVISPSQGRYLYTGKHKHRIYTYTDIHALSWIRTHDPSVRASEDSSCFKPRWTGHVTRVGEKGNARKVTVAKPEGRIPLRISRRRWEDNIKKCKVNVTLCCKRLWRHVGL
jgi:hypothetical protein